MMSEMPCTPCLRTSSASRKASERGVASPTTPRRLFFFEFLKKKFQVSFFKKISRFSKAAFEVRFKRQISTRDFSLDSCRRASLLG